MLVSTLVSQKNYQLEFDSVTVLSILRETLTAFRCNLNFSMTLNESYVVFKSDSMPTVEIDKPVLKWQERTLFSARKRPQIWCFNKIVQKYSKNSNNSLSYSFSFNLSLWNIIFTSCKNCIEFKLTFSVVPLLKFS